MTTTTISTTKHETASDIRSDIAKRAAPQWALSLDFHRAREAKAGAASRTEDTAAVSIANLTEVLDDAHDAMAEAVAQLEGMRERGELDDKTAALVDVLRAEGESVTRAWFATCDAYGPLADAVPALRGTPAPSTPDANDLALVDAVLGDAE